MFSFFKKLLSQRPKKKRGAKGMVIDIELPEGVDLMAFAYKGPAGGGGGGGPAPAGFEVTTGTGGAAGKIYGIDGREIETRSMADIPKDEES